MALRTALMALLMARHAHSSGLGSGTTTGLREIFIGRCNEYQYVINPAPFASGRHRDCNILYENFAAGFATVGACQVRMENFQNYTQGALHPVPHNKAMFWQGVYPFVYRYTNNGRKFTGISDTLLGYPVNTVQWCGLSDFGERLASCPQCEHSSQTEFWKETSIAYSKQAYGVVRVMLNGTGVHPAHSNSSIFKRYELPHLTSDRVTLLHVLVVHDLGKPVRERCGTGSVLSLQRLAKAQGLKYKCTDDPRDIRFLQCADQPDAAECQQFSVSDLSASSASPSFHSAQITSILATVWGSIRH